MNPKHFYARPAGGYMSFYLRVPFDARAFGLSDVLASMTGMIQRYQFKEDPSIVVVELPANLHNCDSASQVLREMMKHILAADTDGKIDRPAVLQHDHVLNAEILGMLGGMKLQIPARDELYSATAA